MKKMGKSIMVLVLFMNLLLNNAIMRSLTKIKHQDGNHNTLP